MSEKSDVSIGVSITVGNYDISRFDGESMWLMNEDGEGMQVDNVFIEQAIHKYFTENH